MSSTIEELTILIECLSRDRKALMTQIKELDKHLNQAIKEKWTLEAKTLTVKSIPRKVSGKSFRGKLLNDGIDPEDFLKFLQQERGAK